MAAPSPLFRPPPWEPDAETRWLLAAAFAARLPPPGEALDGARLATLADRLALGTRIAARWSAAELAGRLGAAAAGAFEAERRATAAAGLAFDELARRLAALALDRRLPLAFLKGFAVSRLATGPPAARAQSDLDVLVPTDRAGELQRGLEERGCRPAAAGGNEAHLTALAWPGLGVVEVHTRVRGLKPGGPGATFEDLASGGALSRLDELPGECFLPRRDALVAHLVAHGLVQHGRRPETYPLLRLLCDLADLLPGAAEREGWSRDWLAESVPEAEVDALLRLVDHLAAGRLPQRERPDEHAAARLLDHFLAATLDPRYARSLRGGHLAGRLRQAGREGRLLAYLGTKLWPPRELLEMRYGAATGALPRLRRRARHLAATLRRLARSLAARGAARQDPLE